MIPALASLLAGVRLLWFLTGQPAVSPFDGCMFMSGACRCDRRCSIYDLQAAS